MTNGRQIFVRKVHNSATQKPKNSQYNLYQRSVIF